MTTPVALAPPIILQFFNNAGQPNVGGTLLTQVGGINAATYQDVVGSVPLPNPIPLNSRGEVSNSSGISCQLFLASGSTYTFTLFDAKGNLIDTATSVTGVDGPSLTFAANLLNASSATLGAAMVGFNPALNYVGQTLGYNALTLPNLNAFTGVDPTGVADSTGAIQAAINLISFTVPSGSTYKTSTAIAIPSNRTIQGCGASSLFKCTSGDVSQFTITSAVNVSVRDIGIQAVAVGTTPGVAAILLSSATDCKIERVDITGVSYSGVMMKGACLRNAVHGCYTHAFQAAQQDAAGIAIISTTGLAAPMFNLVEGNFLYGGCEHGVLVQDPYTLPAVLPARNTVEANFIGAHSGYGVIVYMPNQTASFSASQTTTVLTVTGSPTGTIAVGQDVSLSATGQIIGRIVSLGTGSGGAGTYNMSLSASFGAQTMVSSAQTNSYNKVALNHIDDIQGSFATNRDSGAGVYVVGAGAGGTLVVANTVRNCCVQTLTANLAPAGIGVLGIPSGCAPIVVEGNVVSEMAHFHGLYVNGGNTIFKNNSVTMPASNPTGAPLDINAASNVTASGNSLTHLDTAGASTVLQVFANGANITGVSLVDNQVIGGGNSQVTLTQSGGFTIADLLISANRLTGAGTAVNGGLFFTQGAVISGDVSGNLVDVTTAPALTVGGGITNVNFAGNRFASSGTNSVVLAGTCTGCYFSTSNSFNGTFNDTSTGFYKEILVGAIPSTGTWAVPARAQSTVGTVGQPKGWRLTAAGSPGTWTSEGNL